ncbi:hypothetical protein CQA49_09785, partial [Helicobacter sp. MIT 00-7814]|uniref:hypothetical protein n=1 Tax=unclassified Helicobacter TaxID=2593540 RepID=UPI000E377F4F
ENNFNPLISQINAHLGSGLFGGSIAGLEQDDFGNYTFNPTKFAIGFVAGLAGYDIARRTKAFQNIERISANAKQYYPNLSQKAPDKLMDILRQGIVKKMSGNPSNYITKEKDLLAYAKELDSLFGKQEIENLTSKPKKQRPKPIPKKAQIQQATLFDLSDETLFKEIAQEVKPLLDEAEAKAQAGLFDNHILEGIDTSAPRIQDTPEVSIDTLNLKSENKPTSTTKEPNLFDFESYEPQSANAQLFSTQPKISEDSKTITTQTL